MLPLELIKCAIDAQNNAQAKYSNFYVFSLYEKSLFHQKTDSLQKVFAVFLD